MNQRRGIFAVIAAVVLLAIFIRTAAPKGAHALIDLQLFKSQVFAASAATQFMWNGISFAGQMLIPIYLIRAGGRSPSAAGWLLWAWGCSVPIRGLEP
jgi:hypothetical protein